MITIDSINFKNLKAIIRVDFNVPLNANLQVTDSIRLKAAIPTILKIINDGGSVILMSHLGRPKNGFEDKFSLKHIVSTLTSLLQIPVQFVDDCIGDKVEKAANSLETGQILLLENLRFYAEETSGDLGFAKKLASLADVFVNDAFGTAHRAHASTAIISQFMKKSVFGYVMSLEVENANKIMQNPQMPFTAIVGGSKVSDKIGIIENLLSVANNIIIGGGMAYTFFKAMGGEIGTSLCELDKVEDCLNIIAKAKAKNVKIVLPIDSVCNTSFANDIGSLENNMQIPKNKMGLDIGPLAIKEFSEVILTSKTILWNGPMGVFEFSNYSNGTASIAKAVATATENGSYSLIGGGDSAAAVNQLGYTNKVSYISTGGGALLEYFEGKDLPGIACILNSKSN